MAARFTVCAGAFTAHNASGPVIKAKDAWVMTGQPALRAI